MIMEFFRDTISGWWYALYLFVCFLVFFYFFGIVADNKRERINQKLKEKKTYDIESGKEAAIAAMESKQVLAVSEDNPAGTMSTGETINAVENTTSINGMNKESKEEVTPNVMVLNSSEVNSQTTGGVQAPATPEQPVVSTPAVEQPAVVQPAVEQPAISQPAVEQPVVAPPGGQSA